MQISSTLPQAAKSRFNAADSANKTDAPVEIQVQDVVYIRRDAVDCQQDQGFNFGRAAKIGGSAIIGGASGAVPILGIFTNLAAGNKDARGEASTLDMAAAGGAVLNLAASAAWLITGQPLYMAAPAVAGAIGWSMRAAEQG